MPARRPGEALRDNLRSITTLHPKPFNGRSCRTSVWPSLLPG
ncbi:hypothetical protein BVIR_2937 [Blastochloris viridis]|uniref:Uncharacterized protein n=1 Tax=Blastochloris viridis TaxID=1079 RepID=A0A182D1E8_BLAVI|nr:hypothetical protein BVIR_2937 [Blastochloris viridis]BAR99336.1 hypothetical protein BV133_1743 [Blastochloris viridis]